MRVTTAALVLFGLTACSGPADPSAPAPATYRITPLKLWAGGTLTVESAAFRDLGDGAELDLGLTNIALVRVDDTTMMATLPHSAGGIYDPVVVMGDSLALLDQVEVWGFAATRRYGPEGVWLPWDVYTWPRGKPQVMAGTTAGHLVIINLETEVIQTIPGVYSASTLRGPGATPEDSVYLLRPPGGQPLQSWKLGSAPQKVGDHPEIGGTRQVMRLGLHTWLVTTSQNATILRRSDSSASYLGTSHPVNDPQGVHLSPRKDRATLRIVRTSAEHGVPVFAVPSGDLAYYVPLGSSHGVDWSADGSLLAMAGRASRNATAPGKVVLMDAATGSVTATATTEREVFAVAIDDRRSLVYVGVTMPTGHLAVEVYSRPNLTYLARMEVPADDLVCSLHGITCEGGVLALGINELHAFYGFNGLTRDSRFFLPAP